MPRTRVCRDDDLKEGEGKHVTLVPGRSAYAYRFQGEVRAVLSRCPHMGGPVSLAPDAPELVCAWHEASFDPLTGNRRDGQAPPGSCLETLPVEIVDGEVWISWQRPADPFADA